MKIRTSRREYRATAKLYQNKYGSKNFIHPQIKRQLQNQKDQLKNLTTNN